MDRCRLAPDRPAIVHGDRISVPDNVFFGLEMLLLIGNWQVFTIWGAEAEASYLFTGGLLTGGRSLLTRLEPESHSG